MSKTSPSGCFAASGMRRVGSLLVCLLASAGVAWLVARHELESAVSDVGRLAAQPIAMEERQTTGMTTHTIQSVLSGDGRVAAIDGGFALEAPVMPEALAYKLLDAPVSIKALISGGPGGFDCAWLGLGQGTDGAPKLRCRIPPDVRVVAGLSGTMVLSLSAPVETLALPVAAVVGSAGRGQVVVVGADGARSVRQVDIGVADTFWVEITSGLSEGEQVLAAPVQADFVSGAP